ncbi:hypothetical protein [Streptococcus sp. S784/96/1]|uniref:hypothetical protein n=1 Tax=Streptococcus sp. S784/96/1 TaxID=2653499 RepID=UPI0013868C2A|nr:hypothetical protein [Streptococcus sp. S784/96/1]
MFQVTNQSTFSSWTVEQRDDLLHELEVLHAKRKPIDPKVTFELVETDDNGEIIEKTFLDFPFTGTIDEQLENFGHGKKKKRYSSLFKRLFSFGLKKPKKSKEHQIANSDDVEKVVSTTSPPSSSDASSDDSLRHILVATAQVSDVEKVVSTTLPPNALDTLSDDSLHHDLAATAQVSDVEKVVSTTLPPNSLDTSSDDSLHHDLVATAQVSDVEKVVSTTLPPSEEAKSIATELTNTIEEKQGGLDTLSTQDLQLEFSHRIELELALLDEKREQLATQMSVLDQQREGHIRLLEAINALQLT